MNKKRPSLAFLDIFWVLIPKIIVILAENQYLGRLAGYQGSMICISNAYKEINVLGKFKEDIKKWIPTCKCRLCKTYVKGIGFIEISK